MVAWQRLPQGADALNLTKFSCRTIGACINSFKVRYRGLAKNTARLTMLFALGNLWMARRQIQEAQR